MEVREKKKYNKLLKDTLIFAIGNIGSKLMLFILVPLYTNCLSKAEYGTADLIFTIAQFLIPILSLTIYDAILRFGLAKNSKQENVLLCAIFIWAIGSVISLGLTPVFSFYKSVSDWKWYLTAYLILQMLLYIQQNYLKAVEKNTLYAIVSILHALILALLNICLLLWAELGIEGYLLANIIAILCMVVFIFIFDKMWQPLKKAKIDKNLFKEMIIYSSPLILNNISWWGIQSANKIFVELFLGASILGIFTVATKIPALINVLVTIFSQAWGISSIKEIESTKETLFYSSVFRFYTLISLGACVGVVSIIKPFMAIYVGAEFGEAWKYVPLLLVGSAFSAISSYCGSLYGALKKSVNNMLSTLISAIIGIGFTLIFITKIGLWAAVIGMSLSYVVIAFVRLIDVRRFIKFKIDWFVFILNLCIMIVQVVLVTIEWHMWIVSILAIIMFSIINFKDITQILTKRRGSNEKG